MSGQMAHSKLGASSMHRWSRCPGSVALSQGIPSTTSSYAEEGTLAHDLGERTILAELGAAVAKDDLALFKKTNSSKIDSEMEEAVAVYVRYVLKTLAASEGSTIELEQRFDLSKIYPGCFGTSDCTIYDKANRKLYVIDYKHGKGIPVDIKGNQQLRYYGLGALMHLRKPCDEVELVIVQPRCSHKDGAVRSEVINSMDLLEFSADLIQYAQATEKKDAPLNAGDWCRFCPANAKCPLIAERANEAAAKEFSPVVVDDKVMIGKRELHEVLEWLPVLENWAKSVRAFAYAEASKGRVPNGFKLVKSKAQRKWKLQETVTVDQLMTFFGLKEEDCFKKTFISVAQAEKLLPSTFKKNLEELYTKESSGTVLVPISDKREAVAVGPEAEFKKIESNESEQGEK